jgi:hypothetical protein
MPLATKEWTEAQREQFRRNLKSKWWRINNLYKVKNEQGKVVRFKCRPLQAEVANNLHDKTIILKSRQHGITTLFNVWFVDECIFVDKTEAAFIAQGLAEGQQKLQVMKEIFREFLDEWPIFNRKISLVNDAKRDMRFSNGSYIYVSTTVRSGTVQLLHISELGKIAHTNRVKAQEVLDGSENAIHGDTLTIVESTPMGVNTIFNEMCDTAFSLFRKKKKLTRLDYKWMFLPWWGDPKNSLDTEEALKLEFPGWMQEYFSKLDSKYKVSLTLEQMAWYFKKRCGVGNIFQEHPSTPDECWRVEVEGAFFSQQLDQLRAQGRMRKLVYDPQQPVHTAWDIGVHDFTSIWFYQIYRGGEVHLLHYYENCEMGMDYYLNLLRQYALPEARGGKGYMRYGFHFVPFDAAKRSQYDSIPLIDQLEATEFEFVQAPKPELVSSIAHTRSVLPLCVFDEMECDIGIGRLENYRKAINQQTGSYTDRPVHDDNSHGADAFRTMAATLDQLMHVHRGRNYAQNMVPDDLYQPSDSRSPYVVG